jgi:sodium-independent sulfate anion transporter 11
MLTSSRRQKADSINSASTAADGYIEYEPTVQEWIQEKTPSAQDVKNYGISLFPFVKWLPYYNFQWFIGDLIAGLTVAGVVIPQGMGYAKLANLPVQYGLYTSFMGVAFYWLFATSKDITIGPVAVLSTVTGNVVTKVMAKKLVGVQPQDITEALAIIAGSIVIFLGLARLGWIVEFIPLTSIAAFMTGSALNIAVGQVPGLLGLSTLFNTRDATYKVIINTLKNLKHCKLDAAIGLTALTFLYLIRIGASVGTKRYPAKARLFFFLATLRTVFILLLYTLISWRVNEHHRKTPKFLILNTVPRGFTAAGVPKMERRVISAFTSELPVVVIVMLIEHISISKSFGRVNNYVINPSQELVAMGISNLFGPFVGAYPSTGSFSRTAIKSKAGVRTPLAGVITAIVVLIAIYSLQALFFYIPTAALGAVIIHAVLDLITPPKTLYRFWRISPLEVPIWFAGVLVTVFTSIENGIYTTITVSAALFFWRVFKSQGRILGKVRIHDIIHGDNKSTPSSKEPGVTTSGEATVSESSYRDAFLPIDHQDGSNPAIDLGTPHPGVFIFRFSEGLSYPNAHHYFDYLVKFIFAHTRRTDTHTYKRPGVSIPYLLLVLN